MTMNGNIPRHPEHVDGQPDRPVAGPGIVSESLSVWDCARQHTKQPCVGLNTTRGYGAG